MRKIIFVFLFLGFNSIGIYCQNISFLLTKSSVGNITIGTTVDELYSIIGKDNTILKDLFLEGLYSPSIEIKRPSIICELDCNSVWRIRVFDNNVRFQNGVGIGSTLEDLKKNFKNIEILHGEGNTFAYIEEINMSFALDIIERENNDLNQISGKTKIKWILLF